jgi:hypothetical protein
LERLHDLLRACARLDRRVECALEFRIIESLSPARRVPVDTPSQLGEVVSFGTPEAAADEGVLGLAVDVVARVGSFATGARECRREVRLRIKEANRRSAYVYAYTPRTRSQWRDSYLVGRWVFAEPDISVDAERDVFDGQLGDGLVDVYQSHGQLLYEGVPILERSPVLSIVRCEEM